MSRKDPGMNDRTHNLYDSDSAVYPPELRGEVGLSDETRFMWGSQYRNWRQVIPAGWNDPVAHLIVLQLLLNTQPGTILRTKRVISVLREQRPDYHWSSNNVGRILSAIAMTFRNDPRTNPKTETLLERRDYRSSNWIWSPTPDDFAVLYQMRAFIAGVARPATIDPDFHRPLFAWEGFDPDNEVKL